MKSPDFLTETTPPFRQFYMRRAEYALQNEPARVLRLSLSEREEISRGIASDEVHACESASCICHETARIIPAKNCWNALLHKHSISFYSALKLT